MQPEDFFEGLGLAAVQVRCMIVDAEQRRRVEASRPKRRAGGRIVADFQRIGDIERPNILEILEDAVTTSKGPKFIVRTVDARVQRRPILSDSGGIVAVEDLALRPLGSPMAGGAIGREDRLPSRHIAGLRLLQRPYGEK